MATDTASILQDLTLGVEAARHYASAITLLRGLDSVPVDPETLVGMDVPSLVELNDVRHVLVKHIAASTTVRFSLPVHAWVPVRTSGDTG